MKINYCVLVNNYFVLVRLKKNLITNAFLFIREAVLLL